MKILSVLNSILKSPTTAKAVSTGYQVATSTQPKLAPVAFGGGMVAGVVAMLIGGYRVTDCVRYQTTQGQCDSTIERNLPAMVGGVATLLGGWGAFNTFNPKLHLETPNDSTTLQPKELVIKRKEEETTSTNLPTKEKEEKDSVVPPHPEVILNLSLEGNSQAKIAEMLGISLYAVRKALRNGGK